MKSSSLLATFIFVLFGSSVQAIDFTPLFAETIDDGIPFRRMYFSDGGKRIFYRPPTVWMVSGNGQAATFSPKDVPLGSVRIENAPADHALIPFDKPGLEALRKIARSLVPSDATDIVERWEVVNPVVLQGWTSFEMGFDYLFNRKHCCRSILFINLHGGRQIRLIVAANPADFSSLHKTVFRTLATWWEPDSR